MAEYNRCEVEQMDVQVLTLWTRRLGIHLYMRKKTCRLTRFNWKCAMTLFDIVSRAFLLFMLHIQVHFSAFMLCTTTSRRAQPLNYFTRDGRRHQSAYAMIMHVRRCCASHLWTFNFTWYMMNFIAGNTHKFCLAREYVAASTRPQGLLQNRWLFF